MAKVDTAPVVRGRDSVETGITVNGSSLFVSESARIDGICHPSTLTVRVPEVAELAPSAAGSEVFVSRDAVGEWSECGALDVGSAGREPSEAVSAGAIVVEAGAERLGVLVLPSDEVLQVLASEVQRPRCS